MERGFLPMQPLQVERRIGGAGTGKTQFALDQIDRVRQEKGLGLGEVAFVTFTTSGCEEMAERAAARWGAQAEDLHNFRTAHSQAYRALGVSQGRLLTDDSKSLAWIGDQIGIDLAAATDESGMTVYRPLEDETDEAASLALWDLARVTLRPMDSLLAERLEAGEPAPPRETVESVVTRYESAKRLHDKVDYCDLCLRFAGVRMSLEGPRICQPEGDVPAGVRALFVDECQDNSGLVDAVIMRMAHAPGVEYVLLTGDPMQNIYESFAGGSSKHFMGWPASQSVMPKSYRCPAPTLELGERCLRQMSAGYWDRGIAPADHPGLITQAGAPLDAIEDHIEFSGSTLILARCSYALQPYQEILEDLGIPVARTGTRNEPELMGFSTLWNLQSGQVVTGEDWKLAIDLLPVKSKQFGSLLVEGEKAAWLAGERHYLDFLRPADLEMAGCTSVLANIIRRGEWLQVLSPAKQEAAQKWVSVARRHGPEMATHPRVRLSTIHSAKGLEADTVILSTQSSRRIERGREMSLLRHDEECRVNYVAVTRSRRKLVIVEDGLRHRLVLPW
jgi:superfamily I DNA/RNA helicase